MRLLKRLAVSFFILFAPTLELCGADGTWIGLAAMPDPRQEVGAAELDGKIYVIGGLPSTNRVQQYDPSTNTWRFLAPLPISVDHTAAASVGGKLYVMGGFTSTGSTNAVFEYSPATDQWTNKSPMPTARGGLAAAVISGKIYSVGGQGATQRELEVYDPASNAWARLAPMPTGRNHLAAGAVQGKLYVAGGRPGNLAVLEVYDPATDSWVTRAPMPTGRSGHAGAAVKDKFYTFGGEGNPARSDGIFPEAEAYDSATDSWKTLDPMLTPRHGIGAAVIGNRIYIPGGATREGGGTHTGAHDAFVVQPEKLYFAHFATGGGMASEALLVNLSEAGNSVMTVELFDPSGKPLEADLGGISRSKATITVQALSSKSLRSGDSGTALQVGSVLVSSERPATGTILFSSTISGFRGTAGVGSTPPVTRFLVPVQRDPFSQINSGIALANTTDTAITANLILRNEGGAELSRRTVTLGPRGQIAQFLEQLFPDADIVTFTFRGSVSATSSGNITALALLFTGNDFAALTVSAY